ncbi:hypothetical protein GCM10027159_17720 [Lysobacter terrae]
MFRADAANGAAAPVDLTQVVDRQMPASVYAGDVLSGAGGVSGVSPTAPGFATVMTLAESVDDPTWVDNGGAFAEPTLAAHPFSSAGDIATASAAPTASAAMSNSTDIFVSGNPAIGLDLADDATAIDNTATIFADAYGSYTSTYATGIRARAGLYDSDVANSGLIMAQANPAGFLSYATGVFNHAPEGDAHLSNDGDIHAHASGAEWVFAFGVYNIASTYNDESTVDNAGMIHASANATGGADFQRAWSAGVRASSGYAYSGYYGPSAPSGNDYVRITNNGYIIADASIDGSGSNALAWGAVAQSLNADGVALVENNGTIDAYVHATSVGGAYATFADAMGAYATADEGMAAISNYGDVFATAIVDGFGYARSIAAKAGYLSSYNEQASIENQGRLFARSQANAGYASAIGASTGELDGSDYIQIHNAYGAGVYASAGVDAYGIAKTTGISGRSDQGAYVVNEGAVVAFASLSNTASTYSRSYALSTGVLATSNQSGEARVANLGDVAAIAIAGGTYANSTVQAIGVEANGYDVAALDNANFIQAYASSLGDAYSYGAISSSQHVSYLNNTVDGTIVAVSDAGGYSVAVGALASGHDSTTLTNYGDLIAQAISDYGDAQAFAGIAYGSYNGIGLLINGGDLNARAISGDGGTAQATGAYAAANVASVFNDASSFAMAIAGAGGTAEAHGARAYGMYSAVSNYGDATAIASADTGGSASARGTEAFGYYGSTVYNAGTVLANASATGGVAEAIGSYSIGAIFSAYTTNTSSITAVASGDVASADGVLNASTYIGNAVTINSGDITAVAQGGIAPYGEREAVAFGVYNFAFVYDSIVDNQGTISAAAIATADIAGTYGFLSASAVGAMALNQYAYGTTAVYNSGTISAAALTSQGYASSWGAVAQAAQMYGAVAIENDGLITSYAHSDIGVGVAIGAYANTLAGTSEIVNHGDVIAVSRAERGIVNVVVDYSYATGVQANSIAYGAGESIVNNYGNIEAHASSFGGISGARGIQAYGMEALVNNADGATIVATGRADLFGGGFATGIEAAAVTNVEVVNDGDILAYGHANAYSDSLYGFYGASRAMGIYATANFQGDASITNNGDINAIAIADHSVSFYQGGAGATGMSAYAKYDANVVNNGDINAIAISELGVAAAYGAVSQGKYTANLINAAGASIFAYASVGSLASDNTGGRAVSFGTHMFRGADEALTYNAGTIVSRAVATADGGPNASRGLAMAFGSSVGYNSGIERAALVNRGDIDASADAAFGYASAYGSFVQSQYASATTNADSIRATATADNGDAFAVGSYSVSAHEGYTVQCDAYGCDWANAVYYIDGGESTIDNSGLIAASATAHGGTGHSYGAVMLGGLVAGITNSGTLSARTDADDATAVGSIANSFYGYASVDNSGTLAALATGDIADAIGVTVMGAYGSVDTGYMAAVLSNRNRILAVADGNTATATGVEASGRYDGVSVDNAGTISAAAYGSDATAIAVSMTSARNNVLVNSGTIAAFGDGERIAISSGGTATSDLRNLGSVIGSIRAGDQDDSFDNATGATWWAFGDSDFGAGDDHIVNRGTIVMNDSSIRLGGYSSGNTFDNLGTILVSGAANVIEMDNPFPVYNNGILNFVDGAPDDALTIVGDFAGDGVLNIDVSGLHTSADQIYVEGGVINATQTINVNLLDLPNAPEFEIPVITATGSVTGSFTLGNVHYVPMGFVSMDFDIHQTTHMVALGMEVTGLSGAGSVAADIAPGVQSLMNAQVGTWRQRAGFVPEMGTAGLSPWVRALTDSGDVDPRHSANFGPGGDFGFHQSNHGWELGLDTRPSEHLAIGALIAKVDGSQSVEGAGSDRFDGKTFGLYATWMGDNGFYLDVSHRWTGIDARLRTSEGRYTTQASAQAFNVEAGLKAWTFGRINLVPQLQYTHTRVGDIDALRNGATEFRNDGGVSTRGRIGVAFDTSFQSKGYSLTPYGSLNAVREFDGEYDHTINGALTGTTSTDGTSAMVEMGLGLRRDRFSVTGGVNWTDGGAVESVTGAQLVMRYSW